MGRRQSAEKKEKKRESQDTSTVVLVKHLVGSPRRSAAKGLCNNLTGGGREGTFGSKKNPSGEYEDGEIIKEKPDTTTDARWILGN